MNKANGLSAGKEFSFQAIGHIENTQQYNYEAPRQAVFAGGSSLLKWNDPVYKTCAEDLAGFDRIWLIWVFDRNLHNKFKCKVRVPVPAEKDRYRLYIVQ